MDWNWGSLLQLKSNGVTTVSSYPINIMRKRKDRRYYVDKMLGYVKLLLIPHCHKAIHTNPDLRPRDTDQPPYI